MDILQKARNMAGTNFVLHMILMPTIFGCALIIGLSFLPITQDILGEISLTFFVTLLGIEFLIVFVGIPIAFVIARNNNKLVRAVLTGLLSDYEYSLKEYKAKLMGTSLTVEELHLKRKKILEDACLKHSRKDISDLKTNIDYEIGRMQSLIDESTTAQKIKHQEYFLTVNTVLRTLEKLKDDIPEMQQTSLPHEVLEVLLKKAEESFEAQVHAHEKHASSLKGAIHTIQDEIACIEQLLTYLLLK